MHSDPSTFQPVIFWQKLLFRYYKQTVNQKICAANQSELDLEAFLEHSLNIGYTIRPISKERIADLKLTFIL